MRPILQWQHNALSRDYYLKDLIKLIILLRAAAWPTLNLSFIEVGEEDVIPTTLSNAHSA